MLKKQPHVLHLDDCSLSRHLVKHMCEHNGAIIYSATNIKRAKDILFESEIDMMFVDIDLNGESGLLFVRDIRKDQRFNHIGISMLTSAQDEEMLRIAVSYGADDYLIKPFTVKRLMDTVRRLQTGASLPIDWNGLSPQQSRLMRAASSTIGFAFAEASAGNMISINQVQKSSLTTVQALEDKRLVNIFSDLKQENGQSFIHSLRMGALLSMYAIKMNYSHELLREYATGGILHDIGITKKDARNFNESWISDDSLRNIHKDHTTIGYNMMRQASKNRSLIILGCVKQHHERVDGSGPHGLKGDEISEPGRISAIADIYANLTDKTATSYEPLPRTAAIERIEKERSVHYETMQIFKSIVLG